MKKEFLESVRKDEPATNDPFEIFPIALFRGALRRVSPRKLNLPPGILIANGILPATEQRGIVDVGPLDTNEGQVRVGQSDRAVVAFDHAAYLGGDDNTMELGPSSKDDVDKEGTILKPGPIIMTDQNLLVRRVGLAIDRERYPWHTTSEWSTNRIVVYRYGLEDGQWELQDIDEPVIRVARRIPQRYIDFGAPPQ